MRRHLLDPHKPELSGTFQNPWIQSCVPAHERTLSDGHQRDSSALNWRRLHSRQCRHRFDNFRGKWIWQRRKTAGNFPHHRALLSRSSTASSLRPRLHNPLWMAHTRPRTHKFQFQLEPLLELLRCKSHDRLHWTNQHVASQEPASNKSNQRTWWHQRILWKRRQNSNSSINLINNFIFSDHNKL